MRDVTEELLRETLWLNEKVCHVVRRECCCSILKGTDEGWVMYFTSEVM